MHLTRYSDYSLRVLYYLALYRERTVTISELAEFYHISRDHLVKVVHMLGKNGYISTQRGKHGGLRLARPPQEVTIGAIVRSMEPNFAVVECLQSGGTDCALLPVCGLTGAFAQALEQFLAVLDGYTLADVLPTHPAAFLQGLSQRINAPGNNDGKAH